MNNFRLNFCDIVGGYPRIFDKIDLNYAPSPQEAETMVVARRHLVHPDWDGRILLSLIDMDVFNEEVLKFNVFCNIERSLRCLKSKDMKTSE